MRDGSEGGGEGSEGGGKYADGGWIVEATTDAGVGASRVDGVDIKRAYNTRVLVKKPNAAADGACHSER